MSYVLQVWVEPVPRSLDEAAAISTELHARKPGQNPKFIELARRLTAKHPCITRLPADSSRAVWTGGPLDGRTDAPIYGFGILSEHLGKVHPFVVRTTRTLGLVLFDDQAGQVFLPDGTVSGAAPR